ncbi:cytochrome b [Rhodovibrio salinarum]|uniref:Cytochrome b n=1 Tax=Rhodovibrio salinarum TaxID=1087 RepID=A0A934QL17_9PROT|nr:cytochrome b [Rhodovibrio salinarum]MBK1698659.1 cytochrome b [Rhodovibrio salinarum]
MIKDTAAGYGLISKAFHWGMALLIGWQILKFGDRIAEGEHWVGQVLVPWHVSIGVLLLALIVLRTFWTISQRRNRPPQNGTTGIFATAGHGLLYVLLILQPITGILVMLGGGYGLDAFGVQLIAEGDKIGWAASLGSLHSPLAWGLSALVVGHITMALVHQFVVRDGTLKRMA